jgi:hypothetical protein
MEVSLPNFYSLLRFLSVYYPNNSLILLIKLHEILDSAHRNQEFNQLAHEQGQCAQWVL